MYLNLIYSNYLKEERKTKALTTSFFLRLIKYKNSSYIKNSKNMKFLIKYYYFINEAFVSWFSKK